MINTTHFWVAVIKYIQRHFLYTWKVVIDGVPVGHRFPTFVIAEIGINHNGDIEIAKKLIDAAADAGCQAVKFQKRTIDVVYTAEELAKSRAVDRGLLENAIRRGVLSPDAVARLQKSDFAESTNGDLKRALEFTKDEYRVLFEYAKSKKLIAFASPWDEASVDVLSELDVPCHKIASASITDLDLIRHVKSKGKAMLLSTGMSTIEEIRRTMNIVGEREVILLHTVSTYPADDEHINLAVLRTLQEEFPHVPVGYSGHERDIEPTLNAVVMGACVVERHITLDKTMYGSDQSASLEPSQFKEMIQSIRRWEKVHGDATKRLLEVEEPIQKKLRRK